MAKKAKAKASKKKAAKKTKTKKAVAKKVTAKKASAKKAAAKKTPKKAKKAMAKKAAKGFTPPYKCEKTLEPGVCLKFFRNPDSGDYDLGGDKVPCSTCQYWM